MIKQVIKHVLIGIVLIICYIALISVNGPSDHEVGAMSLKKLGDVDHYELYLNESIPKSLGMEMVYEDQEYQYYLQMTDCYVLKQNNETLSIKDALNQHKVSINDLSSLLDFTVYNKSAGLTGEIGGRYLLIDGVLYTKRYEIGDYVLYEMIDYVITNFNYEFIYVDGNKRYYFTNTISDKYLLVSENESIDLKSALNEEKITILDLMHLDIRVMEENTLDRYYEEKGQIGSYTLYKDLNELDKLKNVDLLYQDNDYFYFYLHEVSQSYHLVSIDTMVDIKEALNQGLVNFEDLKPLIQGKSGYEELFQLSKSCGDTFTVGMSNYEKVATVSNYHVYYHNGMSSFKLIFLDDYYEYYLDVDNYLLMNEEEIMSVKDALRKGEISFTDLNNSLDTIDEKPKTEKIIFDEVIYENQGFVDGYIIYSNNHHGNTIYELYQDDENLYLSLFSGVGSYLLYKDDEFISIDNALDDGLVPIEALMEHFNEIIALPKSDTSKDSISLTPSISLKKLGDVNQFRLYEISMKYKLIQPAFESIYLNDEVVFRFPNIESHYYLLINEDVVFSLTSGLNSNPSILDALKEALGDRIV